MNKYFLPAFYILFCLLILAGCKSEKQLRQAYAEEIGPVDLKPGMTFAQLKTALHQQYEILSPGAVKNVRTVIFGHGLVLAEFHNDFYSSAPPEDHNVPTTIEAYAPFKGTLGGMSIRTSYEDALPNVRKLYPNARIDTDSYGSRINLMGTRDDTWLLGRCSRKFDDETIGGLRVERSGAYMYLPVPN